MTIASKLFSEFKLPCGVSIQNRLIKSAMTEGLADARGIPTQELNRLYRVWGESGAGILVSGNIQVDRDHLERPGNVIIEGNIEEKDRETYQNWIKTVTDKGVPFWAQISHAGRQTFKIVNKSPKAPSSVKLGLPGGQFGQPVALTTEEIDELTNRFARTALTCKELGFNGVQIHSAHGYLLSSFLNPKVNQRDDEYGGSLENRARMLLNIIKKTRELVGTAYPIGVKLNSADFQRGGFQFEDSLTVATWLAELGIDLLEISGGNYEQPQLLGVEGIEEVEQQLIAPSTASREAYFIDFAKAMRDKVDIPLQVTGGFRKRATMDYALDSNASDFVGLARPMCSMPDAPKQLQNDLAELPTPEHNLRLLPNWLSFLRKIQLFKTVDTFAVQYWFYGQLYALGRDGKTNDSLTPFACALEVEKMNRKLVKAARS